MLALLSKYMQNLTPSHTVVWSKEAIATVPSTTITNLVKEYEVDYSFTILLLLINTDLPTSLLMPTVPLTTPPAPPPRNLFKHKVK